ncbi:palmitoyltransferase for Vac8p [Saitozyma podzolica]|uniref:Palmitoyltransferase for Vac8p n=1 Tax=Saitozyma podzolica TaxID=1890683 RepID=A0A427XYL6_9TREE|nr:palmitoyltransferase for Vac8p [Saitozyma podzolica]
MVADGPAFRTAKAKSGLQRFAERIPLYISFGILSSSWIGFVFILSIGDVLLRHHSIWRFFEQMIIFNALMGLTVLSLITASSRSPGHPDPLLAPEGLDHAPSSRSDHPSPSQASIPKLRDRREDLDQNLPADDDDIPLRYLRNPQWVTTRISKSRPSPLPLHVNRSRPRQQPRIGRRRENGMSRSAESHGGNNIMPSISPFPLAMSPFVPNTATDAGESSSEVESGAAALEGWRLARRKAGHEADDEDALSESDCERGHNHNHDHEDYEDDEDVENGEIDEDGDDNITANAPLLSRPPRSKALSRGGRPGPALARQSLMAKSNTGEPRWCRKCDGWKPDRCHHYKPFLLFITYGTLLAIYTSVESAYQTYLFFVDLLDYAEARYPPKQDQLQGNGTDTIDCSQDGVCEPTAARMPEPLEVELAPVVFMLLAIVAGFFTLAVGGLAGYHWYLACKNRTTLEDITHTYPSALLGSASSASPKQSRSQSGSAVGRGWKPDHLLTRLERTRLRTEAHSINVYDLGLRRNLEALLLGARGSEVLGWRRWVRAGWSVAGVGGDGHYGEYDAGKLERLRELTRELRVGEGEGLGAGVMTPRGGVVEDVSDEDEEDEDEEGEDDEEFATSSLTPSRRGDGAVRGGNGGVGWFDAA